MPALPPTVHSSVKRGYSYSLRPAVDYTLVAESYTNTHEASIKKALWVWLNRWYEMEGSDRFSGRDNKGKARQHSIALCDLAAGSGEVTEAFHEWFRVGQAQRNASATEPSSASAPAAALHPVLHPALQTNMRSALASRPAFVPPPRRQAAPAAASTTTWTAGSQYASLVRPPTLPALLQTGYVLPVEPFTIPAFQARLPEHDPQPLPLTFQQVQLGQLPFPPASVFPPTDEEPFPKFDFIVVSFALTIVEDKSELFALLFELSLRAEFLVVIGIGKRPFIRDGMGWARFDLANWKHARAEGFGGKDGDEDEDDEDEDDEAWEARQQENRQAREEEAQRSKIEITRDRVRLRVYRSVGGSA